MNRATYKGDAAVIRSNQGLPRPTRERKHDNTPKKAVLRVRLVSGCARVKNLAVLIGASEVYDALSL